MKLYHIQGSAITERIVTIGFRDLCGE